MLIIESDRFHISSYIDGSVSDASILESLDQYSQHDLKRMLPIVRQKATRLRVAECLLENGSVDGLLTILISLQDRDHAAAFESAAVQLATRGSESQFRHALLCIPERRQLVDGSGRCLREHCLGLRNTLTKQSIVA